MNILNIKINHKYLNCVIPDLLVLIIAIIYGFLQGVIPEPQSRYLFFILLYLLIVLSIYLKLYYWRNLSISLKSYIFFTLNMVQFMLYLWCFYLLLFVTQSPIYLKDLSVYSQYRYLLYFSLIIIGLIIYSVFYVFNYQIPYNIIYPYLKEEIRLVLYSWNDTIFSPICSKIITHMYISTDRRRLFYFSIYFALFNIPRVISTLLLTNFIFFGGDLRSVISMLPVLFIIWLLSFLDYYFNVFFEGTCAYIRLILSVRPKTSTPTSIKGVISASLNDLEFDLTEYGIAEGFSYQGLTSLITSWDQCAQLSVYFLFYKRFLSKFNLLLSSFQIINYFGVVYFFFLKSSINTLFATGFWFTFKKKVTILIPKYNPNQGKGVRYIEASFVKNQYKGQMYNSTDGVQQGKHPPIIDPQDINPENPSEIRYLGQATHGPGTTQNPSQDLHPTQDLSGNPKPQRFIPVRGRHYYDRNWFEPPIPGSKTYLESDPARANLVKHEVQDEHT